MADDRCPWCGEEACERSCTAALAAAMDACDTCGYPLMDDDDACPACGADWGAGDVPLSLGGCCICETTGPQVRTIMLLNARAEVAGHGWGCVQCGLPPNGALAVVCEACLERHHGHMEDALRFACRGYPGEDGRLPITALRGEHGHQMSRHPEGGAHAPLTVLPSDTRFATSREPGQGCRCSRCGETIWPGVVPVRAWPDDGAWECRYHPTCFGAVPMDEDSSSDGEGC